MDATERGKSSNAGTSYENIRRSLRPLQQPPNITPVANTGVYQHSRSNTLDEHHFRKELQPRTPESHHVYFKENESPRPDSIALEPQTPPLGASPRHWSPSHIPESSRPASPQKTQSNSPHPPPLTTALSAPDLETFQKSSTRHLRTLSKIAQSGESEEFQFGTTTPSVVGLQGRRRLKRADSGAGRNGAISPQKFKASTWAAGNWMDQQRQFLQAYEYLCHIGEAKEWIEEVIQKQIPPIVQLEEGLRDGVTLAEVVQAMYPGRTLRIFRNPKLQYRHSDNIALFFRFLDDIELPELFRFELIDLYEKKNLPKVIHCIHALSWLLFKNGMLDFRMGNLVGQLEFEHHELEQTQKGLDKAGVSMPSFAGMAANFGAEPEPEPEPVESEEERIDRELHENELSIIDFQAQVRGAMLRVKLGKMMNDLWDFEPLLIDLQSRLRGDWARQISSYRLSMRQFAVQLQAISRGFIVRRRQQGEIHWRKAHEGHILELQSLIRSSKVRAQTNALRSRMQRHESGIKRFQAAIRGVLRRKQMNAQSRRVEQAGNLVQPLQAVIRGAIARGNISHLITSLQMEQASITALQSVARATAARNRHLLLLNALRSSESGLVQLQSLVRGAAARKTDSALRALLAHHSKSTSRLQSVARGKLLRQFLRAQSDALKHEQRQILDLQSKARGHLQRKRLADQQISLKRHQGVIVDVQALARAALLRIEVGGILAHLENNEDEVVQLQALARAMIVRVEVGHMLTDLEGEEDIITDLQARIRGTIIRGRFEERRRHYNENMEKVIKAQSVIRGRIQGQAYKSLTSGKNPPVGTVKGFVHLLNDSDFDFDEEIEFERLRKVVVQQVRQNEMAEQYISQLDIKIALLVKNKITLDEVVKHQKHFGGHIGNLLSNTEISSKDPYDLKALNKTSRRKLDQYQVFFFLLQTQSQYLARLFRRLRELNTSDKEYERIRHLMMGLFGYSQKRREEYYLVKLLVRSAKEDIDTFASLPEYLRCTSFWNKLFGSYAKSSRDRKFMRDVLGTVVKESVIENPELDLESDPIQIYRSSINNEELRTGQRSHRQPDLPREEAIRDPETRETFIQHLQDLRDIADQFFAACEEFLYRMPFGIRYLAQQTYENLIARFPNEDPGLVLQTVGHWVWKNYFQPALLEPEKYGVVDRGLTQEQKKNLSEIAKVVAQVASGRLFGADNVYLQPLNSYIGESIQRLGRIWTQSSSHRLVQCFLMLTRSSDCGSRCRGIL